MEEKERLLDRYALVQIDASAMTEELCGHLLGTLKTSMGYTALTDDRDALAGCAGVRLSRPSLEDIIVYRGGNYGE